MGNANHPLSMNHWVYTNANPINFTDPSGYVTEGEADDANHIVQYLKLYNVRIVTDWGKTHPYYYNDPIDSSKDGVRCDWNEGLWTLDELKIVENGVVLMARGIRSLGGSFTSLTGGLTIKREIGSRSDTSPDRVIHFRADKDTRDYLVYTIVHEMGHVIHFNNRQLLNYFMDELGAKCIDSNTGQTLSYCYEGDKFGNDEYRPGYSAGSKEQYLASDYASTGVGEDFAETFRVVVSKAYIFSGDGTYSKDASIALTYNHTNQFIGRRNAVMKHILNGSWLLYQRTR